MNTSTHPTQRRRRRSLAENLWRSTKIVIYTACFVSILCIASDESEAPGGLGPIGQAIYTLANKLTAMAAPIGIPALLKYAKL